MFKLLFVCMGNICRSPAAEGVLKNDLEAADLHDQVFVDSAGTLDFHIGKLPDSRMRQAAGERGLVLSHRARQVVAEDLEDFDLILAMDQDNYSELMHLPQAKRHAAKIKLFCEFCTEHEEKEVPDPYYGGAQGFETVLDLLEDGCAEIVRQVQSGALPGHPKA